MDMCDRSATYLRALVCLTILMGTVSVYSQTITWDAEPFPTDSDWPGPRGQPATITANEVILDGQPARTEQTYSGPFLFNFDVKLEARNTTDGALWLFLIPPTTPLDHGLTNTVFFQLGFDDNGVDTTALYLRNGSAPDTVLWSIANPLSAGTTNHISLGVAANGALSLILNGQSETLSNSPVLPFSTFQMQMEGWQPNALWDVTNFAVVPEPSTVGLVGLGIAGLFASTRQRRKR